MGGPGTASLLSAIGGAGASTAGALTGKGDAGQPLVNLSQSLNQQDQQRAQLAQQAQQNALQQRRQEIQDARQNFYIEQAGKTFKQTADQNTLMNTLRAKQESRAVEAVATAGRKEVKKDQQEAAKAAKAPKSSEELIKEMAAGTKTYEDAVLDINARPLTQVQRDAEIAKISAPATWRNLNNILGGSARKPAPVSTQQASQAPASGQPSVPQFNYIKGVGIEPVKP